MDDSFRERMIPLLPQFTGEEKRSAAKRNISIIEIEWYRKFVAWLQDENNPFPGEVTNSVLSPRISAKEPITEHVDYEIVEKNVADAIFSFFKGGPQYLRPLLPDPKTGAPTIIVYPVKLSCTFEGKNFVTTVDPSWTLEDIKKIVAAKEKFDPTTATFLTETTGVVIPDDTIASKIVEVFGSKIQISLPGSLKPRNDKPKTSSCGSVGSVPQALRMNLISEGCMLNAFIQILCRSPAFVNAVAAIEIPEHPDPINDTPYIAFTRYFRDVVSKPQQSYQSEVAPAATAFNASIINRTDEINSMRHFEFPSLFALLLREINIGADLFTGQIMSSQLCPKCGYYNETTNPYTTISLDIKSKWFRKTKTETLLDNFVELKKRDKSNRWECPKCHKKVLVREQNKILTAPQILILHLKRFVKSSSHDINVVTDEVGYGLNLSLAPYTGNKADEYQLIGSIAHVGRSFTQRYKCYVLEEDGKKWTMYNDNRSRPADPKSVFFPEPLLLVYTKK